MQLDIGLSRAYCNYGYPLGEKLIICSRVAYVYAGGCWVIHKGVWVQVRGRQFSLLELMRLSRFNVRITIQEA